MTESQPDLVETLRGRILRGIQAGTLERGERLQSARELTAEFGVDHRLILAAYRRLAEEGLVDIRERGGVYVSATVTANLTRALSLSWISETFTEAYARETSAPDLPELLRRSIETLRLNAVVLSSTADQVAGLARELRDDFGLAAEGFTASMFETESLHTAVLKRADVLIATSAHDALATELGKRFGMPVLMIDVRPDLVAGEWAILLRQPVWAIVATAEFGEMLKRFFANVRGVENLNVLVHGRDDLSVIPEGAPTYVTQRVREVLAVTATRGRLLPAARTIAVPSARRIFDFIVRANIRALEAVHDPSEDAPPKRA